MSQAIYKRMYFVGIVGYFLLISLISIAQLALTTNGMPISQELTNDNIWINGLFTFLFLIFLIGSYQINQNNMRYLTLLFFITSISFTVLLHIEVNVLIGFIKKSSSIILLFAAIPFLSIPLQRGGYLEAIEHMSHRLITKPKLLFVFLTTLYLMIAIPLNIGSIPTMQKLIDSLPLPKKFFSMVYTAGYSAYMVFSPFDGMLNFVLLWTGLTYKDYVLSGLIMVILIIFIGSLMLDPTQGESQAHPENEDQKPIFHSTEVKLNKSIQKVLELIGVFVLMIALVFMTQNMFKTMPQIQIISYFALFFSGIWIVLLKANKTYIKKEPFSYANSLLGYKNFLPFIVVANILGSVISISPLKNIIAQFVTHLSHIPTYFLLIILILFVTVLSQIGVHMLITLTVYGYTITPAALNISSVSYALFLLTCWYIAMVISPLVPFANIVSETVGIKTRKVTYVHNLPFAALSLIAAPIVILLVNSFTK